MIKEWYIGISKSIYTNSIVDNNYSSNNHNKNIHDNIIIHNKKSNSKGSIISKYLIEILLLNRNVTDKYQDNYLIWENTK